MRVAALTSGVHATLAGVLLAMFIPMRSKQDPSISSLKDLEHDLHTVVAFFVLPIFAFAKAGISLKGIDLEQVLHPVSLGIAAGLFISSLAFIDDGSGKYYFDERLGIIMGSLASGIAGYFILHKSLPKSPNK